MSARALSRSAAFRGQRAKERDDVAAQRAKQKARVDDRQHAWRGYLAFQGLNALSRPSMAGASAGKCRVITSIIEVSSTQAMPSFV